LFGGSPCRMKSVHSRTYQAVIAVLREERDRVGLTQQALADRLGHPQSYVAKFERGERRVDVAEFIEIAKAMGASPARLFSAVLRKVP
jgi:transcriptional regulator with XRE-family HTH domain